MRTIEINIGFILTHKILGAWALHIAVLVYIHQIWGVRFGYTILTERYIFKMLGLKLNNSLHFEVWEV